MSRFSSPVSSISLESESTHTLTPCSESSCNLLCATRLRYRVDRPVEWLDERSRTKARARAAVPRRLDPHVPQRRTPAIPTSAMSAADLLAVLVDGYLRYDFSQPKSPANDRLVFSKGHASVLLYAIYRAAGVVTDDEILSYRKHGSMLEGHPTPLIPWVDVATGSLGQGLPIGVGMALAGEAPRPSPDAGLGALRRQRDGRGLDVGGLRARRPLRARQPHGDRRREPARPARRDDGRLEPRRLRRARGSVRLERDRGRRPRRRRDRRGVRPGGRDGREAHRRRRAHAQGKGCRGRGEPERLARQAARGSRGRDRRARRSAGPADRGREARCRARAATGPVEARASALRARHRGRDAQGLRRRARGARHRSARRRRSRRRGVELHVHGDLREGASRAVLRDVHRRAADGRCRGRAPGGRVAAVRVDVRRVPLARVRLRAHGGDQPRDALLSAARTPACRSARTGPRRWRSRTSLRCARSTEARSSIPAMRTRRRSSSRRWPTRRASRTCARSGPRRRFSTRPTRSSPSAAAASCARARATTSR